LALLPRVVDLGAFVTADESKWVYRSAEFGRALLKLHWAETAVTFKPAVPTMWTGLLGLWTYFTLHGGGDFMQALSTGVSWKVFLDVLAVTRLPTALLSAALAPLLYGLVRSRLGRPAALAGALLVACDPFFIAHSRILHQDALGAIFAVPALILALRAAEAGGGWRDLLLSGLLAGLAFLTKSPLFFLGPFVAGWWAWRAWRTGGSARRWALRLAIWGGVSYLTFVALWPAAWVDPIGAPWRVVTDAVTYSQSAEAVDVYWGVVPSLGVAYYPVYFLFRATPLLLAGLAAWLWGRRRLPDAARPLADGLVLFSITFAAFLTFSQQRSDRYILAAFPSLDLVAGAGLALGFALLPKVKRMAIGGLAVAVGLLSFVPYHPYYIAYFNPLVGGPVTAPWLIKVGWGEGLDQAGRWLNTQKDAGDLRVGSYYPETMAPFFAGDVVHLLDSTDLDYIVFYTKQVQGGYPSAAFIHYFENWPPVHTVWLAGIEYARVYRGPSLRPALAADAASAGDMAARPLLFRAMQSHLSIGETEEVDVVWLAGDDLPWSYSQLTLQPADDLAHPPGKQNGRVLAMGQSSLDPWPDGLAIGRYQLTLPAGLPRGKYGLLVDGRPLGEIEAR
jgi:hypothetical protein